MESSKYDRRGILLLSAVAIIFIFLSAGCSQGNKYELIGTWQSKSADNVDGKGRYVLYNFYKEGLVSMKTGFMDDGQFSKPDNKMIGKFKFEDDKKNILITWDDGSTENMSVSFSNEDKMKLGNYEMVRFK